MLRVIKSLCQLIEAQKELLACYRTGQRPRDRTLDYLSSKDLWYFNIKNKWIPSVEKVNKNLWEK